MDRQPVQAGASAPTSAAQATIFMRLAFTIQWLGRNVFFALLNRPGGTVFDAAMKPQRRVLSRDNGISTSLRNGDEDLFTLLPGVWHLPGIILNFPLLAMSRGNNRDAWGLLGMGVIFVVG